MTPNARIGLNVAATYGRSLVALVCGLLAGRWALMALGPVDFGLYGLVVGITAIVTFASNILSLAVGRFYAFEVGKMGEGCEVRKWFSTALFLHVVIPLVLVLVGWPVGEALVRSVFTIPEARIQGCLWTYRISLVAAFVGMVTVPYSAMYSAKQKIAELTVYDIVGTTVKTVALYLMAKCPGDWLVGYALVLALVAALPSLVIALRARSVFPECRLIAGEMVDRTRIVSLLKYAGCECFGSGAVVLRTSGGAFLVNEYLGASFNSTMSYANSVAYQTSTLSQSLTTAFYPAITNAYGAGEMTRVKGLSLGACKFGGLLVLLFAVPLALEADYVFRLWLKTPPPGLAALSIYILIDTLVDRLTAGCALAINASGRVARYQFVSGLGLMMAFPIMWVGLGLGVRGEGLGVWGVHVIGFATVIAFLLNGIAKVWYADRIVGLTMRSWCLNAAIPAIVVAVASTVVGLGMRSVLVASFFRVILVGLVTTGVIFFVGWKWALNGAERQWCCERVRRKA